MVWVNKQIFQEQGLTSQASSEDRKDKKHKINAPAHIEYPSAHIDDNLSTKSSPGG